MIPAGFTLTHIDANGQRIAVYRSQPTGKPLLVCLHGGPGIDSSSLFPGLETLLPLFDLAAIDLRGNGESAAAVNGDYSLVVLAQDVESVVLAMGSREPVGLFGHSFGGCVAMETLARFPKLFSFAILCCAPVDKTWEEAASTGLKELCDPVPDFEAARGSDPKFEQAMKGSAPLYFSDISKERGLALMEAWVYRVTPYEFAQESIFPNMDLSVQCRKIPVPTLVIGAENDRVVPWSLVEKTKGLILNATAVCVPKAGHFPFTTASEVFFQKISQWWESAQKEGNL